KENSNQPDSYINNHTEDNLKSLELIGKWLLSIANTDNNIKAKLLNEITK
ncbi:6975_t:CDS:1, partial [Racocetra persica]